MINSNLLKSIMMAQGDEHAVKKLMEILDLSQPTVSTRLSGKTSFTAREISKIAVHYQMTGEQIKEVFCEVSDDDK